MSKTRKTGPRVPAGAPTTAIWEVWPWNLARQVMQKSTIQDENGMPVTGDEKRDMADAQAMCIHVPSFLQAIQEAQTEKEQAIITAHYRDGVGMPQIVKQVGITAPYGYRIEKTAFQKLHARETMKQYMMMTPDEKKKIRKQLMDCRTAIERLCYPEKQMQDPVPEEETIANIGLKPRTMSCLASAGIWKLSDLEGKTRDQLAEIKYLGPARLKEVIAKAAEHGVSIREDTM